MSMVRVAFFSAVLLATLAPVAAQAQSFNCRAATRPDEILICQDSRLSALDEELSSLYFALRNRLFGGERRRLEDSQASWLQSRYSCGRDYGCIERHYRSRIAQLRSW